MGIFTNSYFLNLVNVCFTNYVTSFIKNIAIVVLYQLCSNSYDSEKCHRSLFIACRKNTPHSKIHNKSRKTIVNANQQ